MLELSNYSPRVREILASADGGQRLMPLVPSAPFQHPGLERLHSSSASEMVGPEHASSPFGSCVESALYLYFSDLDRSHRISQSIPSSTGSFLHGIMHRQEPDYSNSKYWFRRVGSHEVFPSLRDAALQLLCGQPDLASGRLRSQIENRAQWDPFWFVDQCEEAERQPGADLEQRLTEIQRAEWQLLFDFCYRSAVKP